MKRSIVGITLRVMSRTIRRSFAGAAVVTERCWTGRRCVADITRSVMTTMSIATMFVLGASAQEGLWIGGASINGVNRTASGTNVNWDVNELESVVTDMRFRIIVHVDSNGTARLLSRVLVGRHTLENGYGPVMMADERQPAALGLDLATVRRVASTAFPVMPPLPMAGSFAVSNSLAAVVVVEPEDPTNPFSHKFHPDHDNLDAQYSNPLAPGRESFRIQRHIQLGFEGAPAAGADPDYGTSRIEGVYQETITGIHKDGVRLGGRFQLDRVIHAVPLQIP